MLPWQKGTPAVPNAVFGDVTAAWLGAGPLLPREEREMFDDAPRLSLPDETGRRLRTTLENRLLERFIDRVDAAAFRPKPPEDYA